jgi:hypothetical protein
MTEMYLLLVTVQNLLAQCLSSPFNLLITQFILLFFLLTLCQFGNSPLFLLLI